MHGFAYIHSAGPDICPSIMASFLLHWPNAPICKCCIHAHVSIWARYHAMMGAEHSFTTHAKGSPLKCILGSCMHAALQPPQWFWFYKIIQIAMKSDAQKEEAIKKETEKKES